MSRLTFADWVFEPDRGWLGNGRGEHHLRPQTAKVLERLLQRSPDVVSREELREMLWPGTVVVDFDTGINACIKQIRSALGETASDPVHLWTIPKRGFRFVREDHPPAADRRGLAWAALAVIAVLLIAVVTLSPWPGRSPERVVAVMPFEDLAGTPKSRRLRERLLDEFIVAVGDLDPERLGTIARGSVLAVESERLTARQLGERFAASHVLEGSIRAVQGGHIVTISLVEAESDRYIWGELVEVDQDDPDPGLDILRQAALREIAAELSTVTTR